MIIVNIDGPNGVGKTTVTNELLKYYTKKNIITNFVHFHRRGYPIGDLIQKVLNGEIKMNPATLQMLYSTDRLDFSKEYIHRFESMDTEILLVDRYLTSGIVHGMSDGVDIEMLKDFDKYTTKPDINFILTAPVDTLLTRLKTQKLNEGETSDIYETKEKLDKIVYGYNQLDNFVPHVIYVDARQSLFMVVNIIIAHIEAIREVDV